MSENNNGQGLKEILRRYPTGVTVVTSLLNGKPWGGTMNSFTSVSVDPPTVAVFVMDNSRTSSAILETGKFVVNILKHDQEEIAKQFANDGMEDKFQGVRYETGGDGIPLLPDSLGYIECNLSGTHKLADHVMFVGEVTRTGIFNDVEALIYYKRGFHSLG